MNRASSSSPSSKFNETYTEEPAKLVTINEKVNLTRKQYEVLKIICDTYEQSVSECMEEALVEAMQYDIEAMQYDIEAMQYDIEATNINQRGGYIFTPFTAPIDSPCCLSTHPVCIWYNNTDSLNL